MITENTGSDNLIEIRCNTYLCKTQAGFRKLIKKIFVDEYTTNKVFSQLNSYPDKYPAIVIPDTTMYFETGSPDIYIVYPEDFNGL